MSDQTGKPSPDGPDGGDGEQAPGLDTKHAHSARVYIYWLGGKDNYPADQEAAEQAIAANPGIVAGVRANRAFQARAVHGPRATMRDRDAITRFFDGLDLVEPGVVQPQQWRPDPGALNLPQVTAWCGVARKP
jgi:S-adenosyl methyltransferase